MAVRCINELESNEPDKLKLIKAAHNIRNKTTDTELINALDIILSHGGPSSPN